MNMNKNIKPICVVICNFNKEDYVLKAIRSVIDTSSNVADIIVVDNASTDDSVSLIQKYYPDIFLEVLPENVGGAGGFSHGMMLAHKMGYQFISLLDNDAIVSDSCIEGMMKTLTENHDIGVVGPAICTFDDNEIIQEVGSNISIDEATFSMNLTGKKYSSIEKKIFDCDYVPACCLMTRSDVVSKVGGFDVDFFLYWDDIDWCIRVKKAGYRVVSDSNYQAFHKGGGANSKSTVPRYYYWRNKFVFFNRHSDFYPKEIIIPSLHKAILKHLTFRYLNNMQDLLPSLRQALNDASISKLGKYQGDPLPDRRYLKIQLVANLLKPGTYFLDFTPLLESGVDNKSGHVLRVIESFSKLSVNYHFMVDSVFFSNYFNCIEITDYNNFSILAKYESANFEIISVYEHLLHIDLNSLNQDSITTDILLNFIPDKVSGFDVLKLIKDIEFCGGALIKLGFDCF